jgi:hypothetical protein
MRPAVVVKRSWLPCLLLVLSGSNAHADAGAAALAQWNACVGATEAQLWRARPPAESTTSSSRAFVEPATAAACESTSPSSYTLQQWHGRLFVRGVALDALLGSLQHVLPVQDDIIAARFVDRGPGRVHVYLRLVRRTILTVTFDTEHEMTFARASPDVATARSVMTRVNEVEAAGTARERIVPAGADRGLLWRLQSYFRYTQMADGVLVEMQSLTLSRGIPFLLRPVASPIVEDVARESVARTLEAVAARFEGERPGR